MIKIIQIYRLTLDTQEDFKLIEDIYNKLFKNKPYFTRMIY